MYHYYFLSSKCHPCNNKERSLVLKKGMARTWEGKDKAFTKFHLKEAPRQDALGTTAKNIVTGKIVTQVTCNVQANITKTSLEHCWSKLSCQSALPQKEWGTGDTDEIHK